MREWCAFALLISAICFGCAGRKESSWQTPAGPDAVAGNQSASLPEPKNESKRASSKSSGLIVTPETAQTGKVVRYNDAGRFVVLDFPLGRTPAAGQRMFVYRQGLKVGEVKINVWQRENLIVADLTTGEAAEGDEVRNK